MAGYIILAVVVLLAGLMLLPVGADVRYAGGQARLRVQAGPARITLYPRRTGAKPKKKAARKRAKPESEARPPKPKPTFSELQPLIRLGWKALGGFRRRLCVQQVRVICVIACDDPYDTVQRYSAVNAAVNALWPRLERTVNIRQREIRVGFSFEPQEADLQAELALTIRVGRLLAIGCAFGVGYLKWKRNISRARRAEERKQKDGQYDDRKSGRNRNGEDQGNGGLQHGCRRANHHA
ncbi:MAG: hypothetical protein MR033_02380 [Clostridiales bacterium]|nr:hypothetical protein [Clostridiales bacterium]